MQFGDKGCFDQSTGDLFVNVTHGREGCLVRIDRTVFIHLFGATSSGRFHEYWTLLLDNLAYLEKIAEKKANQGDALRLEDDGLRVIHISGEALDG